MVFPYLDRVFNRFSQILAVTATVIVVIACDPLEDTPESVDVLLATTTPAPTITTTATLSSLDTLTPLVTPTQAVLPTPTAIPTQTPTAIPTQTPTSTSIPIPTSTPASTPTTPGVEMLVSDPSQGTTSVGISDVICAPGEEIETEVLLWNVGDGGLAGYSITLSLEQGNVVTFVTVDFPSGFGMNSALPARKVDISFLNIERAIEPGASEARLATLHLQCLQLGQSTILISVQALDDEDGVAIDAINKPALVTVS